METTRTHRSRTRGSASTALLALTSLALLLTGCRDQVAGPAAAPDEALSATAHSVGHGSATAVPHWNVIAQGLVIKNRPNPPAAFRQFAYLSVAQYAAA